MLRAVLPLLLLAAAAAAEPPKPPYTKIAIIKLKEASDQEIDWSVKHSVLRRIREIKEWGADCVILEIQSYGGLVLSSMEVGDELLALGENVQTIAYIPRRAYSGAAMLSVSCREIVMNRNATLGDSQAVYMTAGGGLTPAPEKMQSPVAQAFRKYAERNGYPVLLAEAMVRQEMEVTRYKKPNDPADRSKGFTYVYFRTDVAGGAPSELEREQEGLYDREVVARAGELLTMTAPEAVRFGFCSHLEPSLDALLKSIEAPGAEVRTYDWTWAEKVARWLLKLKAILFLLGAGALYLAFKTPGTGLPELFALLFFGLYFGASAIAGFSGSLEVILFFAGLLLLGVELFVLPGFGIAGVAGLLLLLLALGMSAIPQGPHVPASPIPFLLKMARDFFIGVFGALVLLLFALRHLHQVPFFRTLALAGGPAPGTATGSAHALARPADPSLLGREGLAETTLRPSGRARLDGEVREVLAEGRYVSAGEKIKVVALKGNRIIVRPLETR